MGILDLFKSKNNDNTSLNLSKEDKQFLDTVAVGMWSGGKPKPKNVNDLTCRELHGKVSYCISAKKYDLAEKLLRLEEEKTDNAIDLHFCYNYWIELTYKQRENPEYLNMCIGYCIKDIEMYPQIHKYMSDPVERRRQNLREAEERFRTEFGVELTMPDSVRKLHEESDRRDKQALMDGVNFSARIPSFERLAIIYEKQGRYEDGIKVCELAIRYSLKDGTKSGFDGRLKKLKSKLEKIK